MARRAAHIQNIDDNNSHNPNPGLRSVGRVERRSIPHPIRPNATSSAAKQQGAAAKGKAAALPEPEASGPGSAADAARPYAGFIPTPRNPSHLVDLSFLLSPGARARGSRVLGKAEFLNPGFSIKDRIIRNIIDSAEASGVLSPGMTVCAASSGNTGAALAMYCAMKGYRCVVITNDKCSIEKKNSIKAYGATLLIDNNDYMAREIALVEEMQALGKNWFGVNQYDNQKNPEAYFKTLAPEIYTQTNGTITHFVAAGSTGGTASGCGRYFKSVKPDVEICLADPAGSIFSLYYKDKDPKKKYVSDKKFKVEGVGKNNIPKALHIEYMDRTIVVEDQDAFDMCHRLACEGGIFVGGSAGLNTFAAVKIAEESKTPATVVTILCDTGIKYLSKVYNDEWLTSNGFKPMPNKVHEDLKLAKPVPAPAAAPIPPADSTGGTIPTPELQTIRGSGLEWGSVFVGAVAATAFGFVFRKQLSGL